MVAFEDPSRREVKEAGKVQFLCKVGNCICQSIGDVGSYMTRVSFPLVIDPKEEFVRQDKIIDLEYEAKLMEAIIAAHLGVWQELEWTDRRYIDMAINRLQGAEKRIQKGMSARVAINEEFSAFGDIMAEASEGEAVLDLPGHRNAILIAHDNLFKLPAEELFNLLDATKTAEDSSAAQLDIMRAAFPNLIEAKHAGAPVMVFSARSLPIWVVPYIGPKNVSSVVLPSEEYVKLGHFKGYADTFDIRLAVISSSESKRIAKKEAAEVAEQIKGQKVLLHHEQDGETKLVWGRALSLDCYILNQNLTRGVIDYQTSVMNRDGETKTITLEVDSIKNLEDISDSDIAIGLVKTEFLLESERCPALDPVHIYDFSEERLAEIYEKYLTVAGDRYVTFRLVDESGENSQDFKGIIPQEYRQEFRDRQVSALVRVASEMQKKIGIMIPNFESEEQLKRVYEIAREEANDADDLITVIPMIESTKAIKTVRNIIRDSDIIKEVALGIGDFTADAAHVASRNDPILRDPELPVFYALKNAALIGESVRFVVCGDRTVDPKILLLLEAAGVTNICTATSNYTSVRRTIEGTSHEIALKMYQSLKDGDDPKQVYSESIRKTKQ